VRFIFKYYFLWNILFTCNRIHASKYFKFLQRLPAQKTIWSVFFEELRFNFLAGCRNLLLSRPFATCVEPLYPFYYHLISETNWSNLITSELLSQIFWKSFQIQYQNLQQAGALLQVFITGHLWFPIISDRGGNFRSLLFSFSKWLQFSRYLSFRLQFSRYLSFRLNKDLVSSLYFIFWICYPMI